MQTQTTDLRIYLISLERSRERRNTALAQLEPLPGKVEWIRGVDGYRLNREEKKKCSRIRSFLKYNRPMFPGEFGCALAHLKTLETFIASKESECLIFEDDLWLHPDFAQLIRHRESWLPTDAGIVNFGHDIAKFLPVGTIPEMSALRRSVWSSNGLWKRIGETAGR